jgi:hypothetical protein
MISQKLTLGTYSAIAVEEIAEHYNLSVNDYVNLVLKNCIIKELKRRKVNFKKINSQIVLKRLMLEIDSLEKRTNRS